MSEQLIVRAQVLYQKFPKMVQEPEAVEGEDPEDTRMFRILSMRTEDQERKEMAVKCFSFPNWSKGDVFELTGRIEDNDQYGPTFIAEHALRVVPDTIVGILNYIKRVDGVGPVKAKALVDKFGAGVIDILDNAPERLTECGGIGESLAKRINTSWNKDHNPILRQLDMWLCRYGIGEKWGIKFLAAFGNDALQILQKNPYRAMRVGGIGFKLADTMAEKMGWPERCPERTEAAVAYVVSEARGNGHCFLPESDVISSVRKIASSRKGTENEHEQLTFDEAKSALDRVSGTRDERKPLVKVPVNKKGVEPVYFYYTPDIYDAEKRLAKRIGELQSYPHIAPRGIEETLERVEKDLSMIPNALQRQAVVTALQHNLSILTGGPGTGKTSTLKMLLRTAARLGLKVELCAPTGRAAKRMAELTGQDASTIHILLEWDWEINDFQRTRKHPLDCGLLICDETSMLDIQLADSLMDAVPDSCSVVFVGDIDQLPSVGPGMVLRDLIDCTQLQVTKLDTVFRQAENSLIIQNSHRIRKGETPIFPDPKSKGIEADSYLIRVPKAEGRDDLDWVKNMLPAVINRIVVKYGADPIKNIQILTPMRINNAGALEFNKVLQAALNPDGKEVMVKGQKFRIGDRVMQLANNYKPEMMLSNGDIGFIQNFDETSKEIVIDFYGRLVRYPFKETENLMLAYAATTHKSQGSEFDFVICIMTMHHFPMLERNLLYTANTRAKKLIVFIASWEAIERSVKQCNVSKRNTYLSQRICAEIRSNRLAPAA